MSKPSQKKKLPALNVPVPQSRDEAATVLARIGALARNLARIEHDMNDKIAALKTAAETEAGPLANEGAALLAGLEIWCVANRNDITRGGKVKTADLGTGTVAWRTRPAKVTLRDVEAIIARIKALKLTEFLRTTEEVNKEGMLANAPLARTIAGVTIASAGEDFVAEPFEAELAAEPVS